MHRHRTRPQEKKDLRPAAIGAIAEKMLAFGTDKTSTKIKQTIN